jgi:hypothetical protein
VRRADRLVEHALLGDQRTSRTAPTESDSRPAHLLAAEIARLVARPVEAIEMPTMRQLLS